MLPPFSVPVYQPAPYTYAGLEFQQLPIIAQHYLADVARLMPPVAYNPDPDSIPNQRWFLAEALFRSLRGIDIALVHKRLEAYQASREAELSPSLSVIEDASKKDEKRIFEVLGVLMPERQRTLDEFVLKFDALVWLDAEGHEHFTRENWQAFRDSLLTPILESTGRQLQKLDEAIAKEYTERDAELKIKEQQPVMPVTPSDSDNWRAGPRTPKHEFERTFLDSQDTRGKFHGKGPDYGAVWRTKRRASLAGGR
ncbi:hypothetical protein HYDPIDRAFT_83455 [Hydnomerulius pinastri MD-312]|nr:hypothetical protein HYDPIDRAFT_83455 [Hydnomerulius pinastri MD-312]